MSPDEQKLLSALESIARSMKRTADATEHMAKQSERAADVATEMLMELRRQPKVETVVDESPAEWYRRNGYEVSPDGKRVTYVGPQAWREGHGVELPIKDM